jgi:hypothetical protein
MQTLENTQFAPCLFIKNRIEITQDYYNKFGKKCIDDIYDIYHKPHEFINKRLQNLEEALNFGACVPVVGQYAIAGHFALGLIQIIIGLTCKIIHSLGKVISKALKPEERQTPGILTKIKHIGEECLHHGWHNLAQSTQQAAISFFTFNLLNLAVVLYRGDFKPRIRYDYAEQQTFDLPLISKILLKRRYEDKMNM